MLHEVNAGAGALPPGVPWGEPRSPGEVLADPTMSAESKRALLASWASDRHAVPNRPDLRRPEVGEILVLSDIFEALQALDELTDLPQISQGRSSRQTSDASCAAGM
ncbi:hypothetical protein CHELA1G11_30169 [Hyphomicrobiales bacterium]|nr:hypothetical protein CHELA1G2_30053 [Hyphomicrobiales bacterium]CAH1696311.1 hypothetical protein CHELA1G11_30169 [Hyphomicrobiales bacterium]